MLCEHCSKEARFYAQLAPFGTDPGYHVYHCSACDRFTWSRWWGASQQQQQQQQAQPKTKE